MGAVSGYVALLSSEGRSTPYAIAVGLLLAAAFGLVNGLLVTYGRLSSIIATLATGTIATGVGLALVGPSTVSGLSPSFLSIFATYWGGVQSAFYIVIVLTVVGAIVLQRSLLGRRLFFVGQNRDAAALLGIRVRLLTIGAMVAASVLAGFAGVMLAGQTGAASVTQTNGYLLPAFAAAFLGTSAFLPGRFNAAGTLLATYVLGVAIVGLNMSGVANWSSYIFNGALLIVSSGNVHSSWNQERADRQARVDPLHPSVQPETLMGDGSRGQVLIHADGLSKWFGATHALRGVTLDIRAGEIHGLVGANGSGKSTLVKVLSDAFPADRGQIDTTPGVVVGTVHQNLSLFNEATVRENICGGLVNRVLSTRRERTLASKLLASIGVSIPVETKVRDLPIDQQAFVAVARALALTADADGAVLIVDEVTSVLRGEAADRFAAVLRRLRLQGLGIVLVSHDLDEVLDLADRVTVITDGSVRATEDARHLDRARLIEFMTGDRPPHHPSSRLKGRRRNACSALGIGLGRRLDPRSRPRSSRRRGRGTHRRPGLGIRRGAVPDHGWVRTPRRHGRTAGQSVRSPAFFAQKGGRLIPADRGRTALVGGASVLENYVLGHRGGLGRWGMRAGRRERRAAAEALRAYGVKCEGIDAPIASLSGGNQQKLIMGRCLDAQPSLLVHARADPRRRRHERVPSC